MDLPAAPGNTDAHRESEERLRLTLDAARLGLWSWEVTTNELEWTSWAYRLWGLPEGAPVTYTTFLDSLHPDDRAGVEATVNESLACGREYNAEYRILLPDGRERWIAATGRAELDPSGHPIRLRGSVREITRRKHAEEALRRAESTQRSVMESSIDSIMLLDLDGTIRFINRTAPGLTIAEVIDSSIYGYVEEPFRTAIRECFARVVSTGKPDGYTTEYTAAGGARLVYEARVAPVRTGACITGLTVVARDVTEQRVAEHAFREVVRRKSAILETALDCIITIDHRGQILDWNPAAERTFGYPAREAIGRSMAELIVPPASRDRHVQGMARYLATGEGPMLGKRVEMMAMRSDGTEFVAELAISVITGGEDPVFTAYLRDVTERTRAAQALRTREETFRLLLENASDLITVITNDGVIRYQSPSIRRVLGYQPDEFVGQSVFAFVHPDDRRVAIAGIERALTLPGTPNAIQIRVRHKNGEWRLQESIGRSVPSDAGEGIIVVNSRDISESRRLEEQLLQSQKMDAIGQLAGGVAHDFNNILTVLIGHAEMAASRDELPADVRESVQEIRASALRASELTRQLLLFSRRQVMQPKPLDLNDVVGGLSRMLRRVIREDVQLHLHLHTAALRFRADPGMIEQVLLNLAVNARDAMPQGGRLLIETNEEMVDEARARLHPAARPGHYVSVSVTDTGHGIAPDVLPRIFEPFFTTKEVGKGTGLGLATVFGVVEQHQGWIEVDSAPGRGTEFRVLLPADEAGASDAAAFEVPPAPRGGAETILLIEDEAAVRQLAARILARNGYTVHTAANGPEGLARWHECRDDVALVITDLVMPGGLSGHQLARQIAADSPSVRLMYLSGYARETAGREFDLTPSEFFLQKPFTASQLLDGVRQVLDR